MASSADKKSGWHVPNVAGAETLATSLRLLEGAGGKQLESPARIILISELSAERT